MDLQGKCNGNFKTDHRCHSEFQWLLVSVCDNYDEQVTFPGCTSCLKVGGIGCNIFIFFFNRFARNSKILFSALFWNIKCSLMREYYLIY